MIAQEKPLRRTAMARVSANPRCKQCRNRFVPARAGQLLCGDADCAAAYAEAVRAKRLAAEAKAKRAQGRADSEAAKGLRQLLRECQDAFNEWVRLRDADEPCIACGDPFEPNKPGGSMDAGHFRARSVAPQLRFEPDNVFGQHKDCNRPGGTTYAHFRAGVIARVGLPRVEELEANNTVKKWDKAEVRALRDYWRAQVRDMKKSRAAA